MGIVSGCNKVNNKIPVFIDLPEVWIFKSIYPGLAAIEQEVIPGPEGEVPISLQSPVKYKVLYSLLMEFGWFQCIGIREQDGVNLLIRVCRDKTHGIVVRKCCDSSLLPEPFCKFILRLGWGAICIRP